jgi:hypothetical protein
MAEEKKKLHNPERRKFLQKASLLPAGLFLGPNALAATQTGTGTKRAAAGEQSMMGHVAPKLDRVRIGVIGAGRRGTTMLRLLASLDGVDIKAVCDPYDPAIDDAKKLVSELGAPIPDMYANGDYAYRTMLERDDIDAVLVLTPWFWHTPMAIDVMLSGKHALVEVPAALTLDQCWQLVETSEKTRMNCMMMENVCYGREEMMALNMVRQGVLGELLHGEAAYIHELRWQMKDMEEGTGSWRTGWHTRLNANLYPTHGLGPIAQYMNINRGDRFDYLTSMSSPALGRQLYAQREFAADHPRNQVKYICGDMNTSLIKTVKGRTIMVQHDTATPRPYTRHNLIQGTNGVFGGYPERIALDSNPTGADGEFHDWQDDMAKFYERYDHPLWIELATEAKESIGHGGMDFVMLWRTVYCLRNGVPLDQNVYDAASWSAVTPLSASSVSDRGNSVDFPDFTRGAWATTPALEVTEAQV